MDTFLALELASRILGCMLLLASSFRREDTEGMEKNVRRGIPEEKDYDYENMVLESVGFLGR